MARVLALFLLVPLGVTPAASANPRDVPLAAAPLGSLCDAVAASSPSAAQEHAAALRAERWASARLEEALDRLVLARGLAGSASPAAGESAARLIRDLHARDVGFWVSVKRELCACPVFGSSPPASCAELGRERHRALCDGAVAHRGRGVDVCRLTKGR